MKTTNPASCTQHPTAARPKIHKAQVRHALRALCCRQPRTRHILSQKTAFAKESLTLLVGGRHKRCTTAANRRKQARPKQDASGRRRDLRDAGRRYVAAYSSGSSTTVRACDELQHVARCRADGDVAVNKIAVGEENLAS